MRKKLLLLSMLVLHAPCLGAPPMYICTAADQKYFKHLVNLIGSLFKTNSDNIEQIAVFDLGLTQKQLQNLANMEKVSVHEVELLSPDILKPRQHAGRMVPGLYAWKPVIIKQALDLFPYILYLDAGTTVLNPLDDIFNHIIEQGYFLVDCNHSIAWMTPQAVAKKFNLHCNENAWILSPETRGIDAGLQGLSRAAYARYVQPMYALAQDINNFIDDGTTPNGFGTGRHDQTLFSIRARLENMMVHIMDNGDGKTCELEVGKNSVPVHITWNSKNVRHDTVIFHSRKHMPQAKLFKHYIRYKDS